MHESEAMALIEIALHAFTKKYFEYFKDNDFNGESYRRCLQRFAKAVKARTAYDTEKNAKKVLSAIVVRDMRYVGLSEQELQIDLEGDSFSQELDSMLDAVASENDDIVRSPFDTNFTSDFLRARS